MPQPADLARAMVARGLAQPAAIEWHGTIGSTNDRLKELARAGAGEWTIVLADRQTSGRGRERRAWASPAGGLYLSVLLRPRFLALSLLPIAAGVAVAEMAAEHGLAVALKWPNDVVVPGDEPPRKLAGILAEAATGATGTDWVVLGIGVNLMRRELPAELLERAAALDEGAAFAPDVAAVAAAILAQLRVWYDAVGSSPRSVIEAWRTRALAWWGESVAVQTAGGLLCGRLLDVDGQGALLVEVDGETRRLLSGDVVRLRREG